MPNPFGKETWQQSDYARKRWQSDYDAYLARIEQYKGSSFYDELLNNPYYQFQDFQGNFFQGVWANTVGDYSAWDKFYNDRKTSGDEYMSQILDAQRQQQYDDPAAQLARRKAAGLNDDLNGGQQIGTGTPGEAVPDDTPPTTERADPMATISTLSSIGFQFFQSGLSLVSFFQDYKAKQIALAGGDFDLTNKGYDSMLKILAGSSSMPATRDEYEGLSEEEKKGMDDQLFDTLEASIARGELKGMFSTRRAKALAKAMRGTISYDKDGKPTLAYQAYRNKLMSSAYGDLKNSAEVIGTPGFSENVVEFGNQIAETFGAIDLRIRQAQDKIAAANARSAEAKAGYDQTYYGTVVDGQTVATADAKAAIAGDQMQVSQAENQKIIEDMKKDINKQFDDLWQFAQTKGGLEGLILRLLIPNARAQTMQVIEQGFGATVINRSGLGPLVGSLLN